MQWVVFGVWQTEHGWEGFYQLAAHVASELVRAAEEHGCFRITRVRILGVLSSEVFCGQTVGRGAVRDTVIEATPDERDIARGETKRRLRVVEPEPGMPPHDCMDGKLDGAGQTDTPRGSCDRTSKDATGRSCSDEVFLEHVHVWREYRIVIQALHTLIRLLLRGTMIP